MVPANPKRDENDKPRRGSLAGKLWGIRGVSSTARGPLARYGSMGFELGASIIGLTLLGLWIDHHFGTSPVWVLVGAGLGITGGFYNFLRSALRMSKPETRRTGQSNTDEEHDGNERR